MINPRIISLGVKKKDSFKFNIVTTGSNETFTLPLLSGTHNFTVNWGDGTADSTIITYNDINRIHTYASAGTYKISMWGTCTKFSFNNAGDRLKIRQLLDFVDMGFTILNFCGCENLTSIASSMRKLKSLTTAVEMFRNCYALTSIPSGIFDGSTGITSFYYTFQDCRGLTSIPSDLFRYNTAVTNFGSTFINCIYITSIPSDLFRYNTAVTDFNYIFNGCTRMASIPSDLFRYNTTVTDFSNSFGNCPKLQLNSSIFYAVGEEGTRFLNKSVNFSFCFFRTSFTGTQGTAPDLWNCNFGTGTPTRTACYGGLGNSITSLTNYNDIPVNWK
jgi:hypothetical protein